MHTSLSPSSYLRKVSVLLATLLMLASKGVTRLTTSIVLSPFTRPLSQTGDRGKGVR